MAVDRMGGKLLSQFHIRKDARTKTENNDKDNSKTGGRTSVRMWMNTSPHACFSEHSCIAYSELQVNSLPPPHSSVHSISDRKVIGHRCSSVPLNSS